jgi:hypothetical protein
MHIPLLRESNIAFNKARNSDWLLLQGPKLQGVWIQSRPVRAGECFEKRGQSQGPIGQTDASNAHWTHKYSLGLQLASETNLWSRETGFSSINRLGSWLRTFWFRKQDSFEPRARLQQIFAAPSVHKPWQNRVQRQVVPSLERSIGRVKGKDHRLFRKRVWVSNQNGLGLQVPGVHLLHEKGSFGPTNMSDSPGLPAQIGEPNPFLSVSRESQRLGAPTGKYLEWCLWSQIDMFWNANRIRSSFV